MTRRQVIDEFARWLEDHTVYRLCRLDCDEELVELEPSEVTRMIQEYLDGD